MGLRKISEDDLNVLATASCGSCGLTWDVWVTENGEGRMSDMRCPGCDGTACQVKPHESLT